MRTKTYLVLVIVGIIVLIAFSFYEIMKLKNEIKDLRDSNAELMDERECYDLFYDNEGLVILNADQVGDYCKDLVKP